jgi:2-oxoglutarate dehydrogenase E1 component
MSKPSMQQMWDTAYLSGTNAAYVEALYDTYLVNPEEVPEQWHNYFATLPRANGALVEDIPRAKLRQHFVSLAERKRRLTPTAALVSADSVHERKQVKVLQLIDAYRVRGHQKARLDPLGLMERPDVPDLSLNHHQLSPTDLETVFQTGPLMMGKEQAKLAEIIEMLEQTYCHTVGAEYMHIVDTAEKRWLQQRLESSRSHPQYPPAIKHWLLEQLTAAEGLEKYLGSRYAGAKRFGLEGGESLIPLVNGLIQRAGSYGAKEMVIGMAHRGRLNVLVNILGKRPRELFEEFEGKHNHLSKQGSGDVKYHQGFSSDVETDGGVVHLSLAFNPSHLEIVSPVVEGSVRARQDRRNNAAGHQVVPILVHGDAAFVGQGVVMETFQMSQTRGFTTGGTIHLVCNNRIGFTTSRKEDARSTEYCTDVAKMVQAPIFHVNGDDPEAVLFITQLAMDYRQEFKKDVVIDLVCYRRRGHNEADEPMATQPLMYQKIKQQPSVRTLYAKALLAEGAVDQADVDSMELDYREALEQRDYVVKQLKQQPNEESLFNWLPYIGQEWTASANTSVELATIKQLADKLDQLPENFVVQRQVAKTLEDRHKMSAGGLALNWGYGELMAYATLLNWGIGVRLTGQDVGRGTFSHRHAVLHNQKDGSCYIPLNHLADIQPEFEIYDSLLSEEAVLGFEYGYSSTNPERLVIWEAQFGDFANGAQVVIDQFITSGEHKWGRLSGLVMLLPHGYEGQGPEHSSARLERYLQLCAEHNIQVCVPTTPAQVFHMLRRQVLRPLRKPLIVMSPKSLLRHKQAVSSLEELVRGEFHTVLAETEDIAIEQVKRIILCSGKVYYDLFNYRQEQGRHDTAIIRIEQLYPFPVEALDQQLIKYAKAQSVVWCQEEPMNQGAWYCSQHNIRRALARHHPDIYLDYAGRQASAAPAAGYATLHAEQQKQLIEDAFNV